MRQNIQESFQPLRLIDLVKGGVFSAVIVRFAALQRFNPPAQFSQERRHLARLECQSRIGRRAGCGVAALDDVQTIHFAFVWVSPTGETSCRGQHSLVATQDVGL